MLEKLLEKSLNKIQIILVNTSHPGNIGSAARAMKTMGLSQLVLVNPESFPDPKAIEMSSHADDIVNSARVVSSLKEALEGCSLAIGTSARMRSIDLRPLNPKECAEKLIEVIKRNGNNIDLNKNNHSKVALVFGREKTGLTNEELLHCHYHVMIPSNPEYSSLNLAAAVQVLCYELRVCALTGLTPHPSLPPQGGKELELSDLEAQRPNDSQKKSPMDTPLATVDDIEKFYAHLETLLAQLGFLKKENPTLMPKVRRIFNRIQLEKPEINILRGMLTAVQRKEKLKLKELQALQQLS